MSLQLLNVQEPSHEQDARNDVFSHVLKNVKVINQHCSVSAKRNWKRRANVNVSTNQKTTSDPKTSSNQ